MSIYKPIQDFFLLLIDYIVCHSSCYTNGKCPHNKRGRLLQFTENKQARDASDPGPDLLDALPGSKPLVVAV